MPALPNARDHAGHCGRRTCLILPRQPDPALNQGVHRPLGLWRGEVRRGAEPLSDLPEGRIVARMGQSPSNLGANGTKPHLAQILGEMINHSA
jgi:hypothetical protein